jgi:hypothetical protein
VRDRLQDPGVKRTLSCPVGTDDELYNRIRHAGIPDP